MLCAPAEERSSLRKDLNAKSFFESNERFADLLNGLGGGGLVRPEDIREHDSQTFVRASHFHGLFNGSSKAAGARDVVRKVVSGTDFMVVGIENQETVDYSMVLRNMGYDAGEYDRQAAKIRREVRNGSGASGSEYMYGFMRDSRLKPVVTLILYYGADGWDGPRTLKEMLDLSCVPDGLAGFVKDYSINLIEVRKLKNTDIFKTDVKQVFDYIRYSKDKKRLRELVENDPHYREMDPEAYAMAAEYSNSGVFMEMMDKYENGGKINMCQALTEMLEDEKNEGINQGICQGISQEIYEMGREFGLSTGQIKERLCRRLNISNAEADALYDKLSKQ